MNKNLLNQIYFKIELLLVKLKLVKFMILFYFSCATAYFSQLFNYWIYKYQNKFIDYEIPNDLDGFLCVITGGSGEIGLACVKKLLKKNCKIIIATIPNSDQTIEKLEKQLEIDLKDYRRDLWELNYLDLGSFQSINEFTDNFKKTNRKIDILINNAGVFLIPFGLTEESFEKHIGINYLGHCLLTLNLMPVLEPSKSSLKTREKLNLSFKSKVINISSHVHYWVKPDLKHLNRLSIKEKESFSFYLAYSLSKLFIIAFYFYLSKINSNIHLITCHPGGVASKMVIKSPINKVLPVAKYEDLFRNTFLWPADHAALHVMHGIFSKEFENQNEIYLENFSKVNPNRYCRNKEFQLQVYKQTINLLNDHLTN